MDNRRDLRQDLELCEKATPGPWEVKNKPEGSGFFDVVCPDGKGIAPTGCRQNALFIAAARTGWPEAIMRAIKAEDIAHKLGQLVAEEDDVIKQAGAEIAALREENEKVWEELYNLREVNRRVCEQNEEQGEALTNCVTWFTSREVKACFGLCNAHRGFEVSREFSESAHKIWDKAKALAELEGGQPCTT
jgi:hypothetical protein